MVDETTRLEEAMRAMLAALDEGSKAGQEYRNVCAAMRGDPTSHTSPKVAEFLALLVGYDGMSTKIAAMKTILATHRANAKGEAPHVHVGRPGQNLTEELRDLGYAEAPDGLSVPAGFSFSGGTITNDEDAVVALRPIVIVGRALDAETGESQVTLAWEFAGSWVEQTVARTVIADSRSLIGLSHLGAPVDSCTSSRVVSWLRQQEHAAKRLPTRLSMGRLGWLPGGGGFLLGARSVGDDAVLQAPGPGEQDHAKAYVERGSLEAWKDEVWGRVKNEAAGLVVLASLAAPLLEPLDAPGWTLDIGGESSTGKTTALRVAASVYGDPSRLVTPWPRTWAAGREAVAFRSSLPTMLDDTKNLGGKWETAKLLVYAAADRQSQALGSPTGGTRRSRAVRTVLISTGEAPLIGHCGDARGAAARILPLARSMWREGMAHEMRAVHGHMATSHGAVGRKWIAEIHRRRELWPAWQQAYRDKVDEIAAGATDEIGARVSQYVAHLRVTATLASKFLGLDVPDDLIGMISTMAQDGAEARDTPLAALEWVMGWGSQRPSSWHDAPNHHEPFLGERVTGYHLWYPESLERALREGGFPPKDVLPTWRRRGWLYSTEQRNKVYAKIGKSRARVYKIDLGAIPEDAKP